MFLTPGQVHISSGPLKFIFLFHFPLASAWHTNHGSSNQPLHLYYKYQYVLLDKSLDLDDGENKDLHYVSTTAHIYTLPSLNTGSTLESSVVLNTSIPWCVFITNLNLLLKKWSFYAVEHFPCIFLNIHCSKLFQVHTPNTKFCQNLLISFRDKICRQI